MVLASSAAAAAPAYELPRPLALCSIRANAEAWACEAPPAKAPATASERAVFLIRARSMRISLGVIESRAVLAADTIAQRHSLANGPLRRQGGSLARPGLSGEGHPRELALADLQHDRFPPFHGKPLVGDLLAVDAHAALLDHAQGLRRAGDQLRLLEYLRDRHLGNLARCRFTVDLDCNFRNALGHRAMLETCLEIGLGALRRRSAVKTSGDLAREEHLDVARVATAGDLLLPLGERFQGFEGEQLQVAPHQLIGDRHQLSEDRFRGFVDTNVVVERLRHLVDAAYPFEKRHRQDALLRLTIVPLELAPHQQIELLVGPPEFNVGFHRHRIVALHEWVKKLVDGDGLPGRITFAKIVALEHARDRPFSS